MANWNKINLSVDERGDEDANHRAVRDGLRAYNTRTLPQWFNRDAAEPMLNVYAHDANGQLIGGVTCHIEWDALNVEYVWVDESARGQGVGRLLMRRAEAEARARGCTWAMLTTFDFQARGFYEKLGYRVVGQYDNYPPGHTYYFLRRELGEDQ
jgi:GNAT superfamily N-acetyltransferase